MKNLLLSLVLITAASALTSCNTVKGVGQDVSAGGKAITKSAEDVQKKM